jgi:hypothetical protein
MPVFRQAASSPLARPLASPDQWTDRVERLSTIYGWDAEFRQNRSYSTSLPALRPPRAPRRNKGGKAVRNGVAVEGCGPRSE